MKAFCSDAWVDVSIENPTLGRVVDCKSADGNMAAARQKSTNLPEKLRERIQRFGGIIISRAVTFPIVSHKLFLLFSFLVDVTLR